MLFNSWEFLLLFLPVTFAMYFFLNHLKKFYVAKGWLFFASLIFYGWWNPGYLLIISVSIVANFAFAQLLTSRGGGKRKGILILGIVFNIALLGYYKYADFFIENFNYVFGYDYNLLNIILPLGISFFTFQQIAYLVDTYKGLLPRTDFVQYGTFVTFFPQLIAGPITHHREMIPQFEDPSRYSINTDNIAKGLFIFNMGLAKKIIIADTFGKIVNAGYGNYEILSIDQSWITAFAYTLQLYFDFSGYSDMAIGLGLFFNIDIPVNFNSPHRSKNIQEFYRRWHMTLSSFMRNYIYIPLGGNKGSDGRTNINLFLTFLIGGFWHGANWTFVVWGALNGIALVIHRIFKKTNIVIHDWIAVAITFIFVMIVRIFFRAENIDVANNVILKMFGIGDSAPSFVLISSYFDAPIWIAAVILLFSRNTVELGERFVPNLRHAMAVIVLIFINLLFMNSVEKRDFLYFDF